MRRRLEPLRVRPFGRLLGSYTVNDLGDSIGVVALSILVFDRTQAVAPTAGFFLVAKFLPALFATGLTAHLDRSSLRRTLPALYAARGAGLRARWPSWPTATGSSCRWCSLLGAGRRDAGHHRPRPDARRRRARSLQPTDLISEGNALMNLGLRRLRRCSARRSAGALIAAFGLSAALLVDAASFLVIAVVLAVGARPARGSSTRTAAVARALRRRAASSRATSGSCGRC